MQFSHAHTDLLDVPPGFEHGLKFDSSGDGGDGGDGVGRSAVTEIAPAPDTVKLSDLLLGGGGGGVAMSWEEEEDEEEEKEKKERKGGAIVADGSRSESEGKAVSMYRVFH